MEAVVFALYLVAHVAACALCVGLARDRWGPGAGRWGLLIGLLLGPAGALGLYLVPRAAREALRRALEIEDLRAQTPTLAALRAEDERRAAARRAADEVRRRAAAERRAEEAAERARSAADARLGRERAARARADAAARRAERHRAGRAAALEALRAERDARRAAREHAARVAAEGVEVRCPRCGAAGRMLPDQGAVCRCGVRLALQKNSQK